MKCSAVCWEVGGVQDSGFVPHAKLLSTVFE